jgi:hypothetical protein
MMSTSPQTTLTPLLFKKLVSISGPTFAVASSITGYSSCKLLIGFRDSLT